MVILPLHHRRARRLAIALVNPVALSLCRLASPLCCFPHLTVVLAFVASSRFDGGLVALPRCHGVCLALPSSSRWVAEQVTCRGAYGRCQSFTCGPGRPGCRGRGHVNQIGAATVVMIVFSGTQLPPCSPHGHRQRGLVWAVWMTHLCGAAWLSSSPRGLRGGCRHCLRHAVVIISMHSHCIVVFIAICNRVS